MKKINTSLSTITIIYLLWLTGIVFCFCAYAYYKGEKEARLEDLSKQLKTTTSQLSKGLSIAVWNFDEEQMLSIMESALLDKSVTAIVVEINDQEKSLISIDTNYHATQRVLKERPQVSEETLIFEEDIVYLSDNVGKTTVYASTENLFRALRSDFLIVSLIIVLLMIVMVLGVYFIFYVIIIKPLRELELFSSIIDFKNPRSLKPIETRYYREIDHLSLSLQRMLVSLNENYKQLAYSEKKFKDMADLLPQGIFELDLEGNIFYLNQMGLKYFGFEGEKLKENINMLQLIAKEDHEKILGNKDMQLRGEAKGTGNEYLGLRKDGSTFPLLVYSALILEHDKPVGIRGIAIDLTEIREHEVALQKLKELNYQKEKEAEKSRTIALMEGQEIERLRISREIHDGIGQLLTVIKLGIDNIEAAKLDSKAEQEKIESTKNLISEVILEVRQVSSDLSPTFLYDYGLYLAVKQLIRNYSRISEIRMVFQSNLENVRLLSQVEIALYRIIQEAVNNAVKYSKAKNIEIHLIEDAEFLELLIKDDGSGVDLEGMLINGVKLGNGLLNMKSRAALIGGIASIVTEPGKGFQLNVQIPAELIR